MTEVSTMMSAAALQKMPKDKLISRWRSMAGRLERAKDVALGVAERGSNAAAQGGGFTVAYIARRVMKLKGMKTGFGNQQQIDGFMLAGIATALFGVSPWSGKYGSLVASGGMGIATAGSTDLLDRAAEYIVNGGE